MEFLLNRGEGRLDMRNYWPHSFVIFAGCANSFLAHSRSGRVRWRVVYPNRPDVAMLCEDSHSHFWQADLLLVHKRLGAILYGQRIEARRHDTIHAGWTAGIRGEEGVTGEVSVADNWDWQGVSTGGCEWHIGGTSQIVSAVSTLQNRVSRRSAHRPRLVAGTYSSHEHRTCGILYIVLRGVGFV